MNELKNDENWWPEKWKMKEKNDENWRQKNENEMK